MMYIIRKLIVEEFNYFLEDMEQNRTFCEYLDVLDYSVHHNEMQECRKEFKNMIIEWLRKNKPNKYYIIDKFDIINLMTKKELIKRNLDPSRYEIIQ